MQTQRKSFKLGRVTGQTFTVCFKESDLGM